MMSLEEKKTMALAAYKEARAAYLATVDKTCKGDPEAWRAFCETERNCSLLGIRH